MKTNEERIKSLEALIKTQSKAIDGLIRKVALMEKENSRRKNDIEELKRNVNHQR